MLFQRHFTTSRASAVAAEPNLASGRGLLLAFLRDSGTYGATDEEMQRLVPMGSNTQRPRRVELVAGYLVVNSGRNRTTKNGHPAVVWMAREFVEAQKT
jgi:hypothetical protein